MASKWSGMADGNTKKVENIFTTWPDKSSILDIIKSIASLALCRRYMDGHIKKNFIMWNGHLTDTWGFIYYGPEDGQTINIRVSSVLLVCTAHGSPKNERRQERDAAKLTSGSTWKMLTPENSSAAQKHTQTLTRIPHKELDLFAIYSSSRRGINCNISVSHNWGRNEHKLLPFQHFWEVLNFKLRIIYFLRFKIL
jgi:hypothetical protein